MFKDPSYHEQDEFRIRQSKLEEIRQNGIDPYPHLFKPEISLSQIETRFHEQAIGSSEEAQSSTTPFVKVAGRLVLFRPMGKNIFAQIQEGRNKLQLMFNRDETKWPGYEGQEVSAFKFFEKKLDLGDILGIEGHLFRTHKGEITIFVKSCVLLCKALLPLPDKHSGLLDKEMRYRKRWLDLLCHGDVFNTFTMRSKIHALIRQFFTEEGFMEIETPTLQNVYGGASAKPFTTVVNALDKQEMFLRISLEIPLKQLIVGGFSKLFEMGKVFRNEGLDKNHNPEFTELEAYAAYWDYNDMMRLVEHLFEFVALALYGTTSVPHTMADGSEIQIEMKAPWKRLSMIESLQTYAGVDISKLSDDEMKTKLIKECGGDPKNINAMSRGLLIAELFAQLVEQHLIQPHHIIDHPIETTPLCKLHRDPQKKAQRLVERFESFVLTHEVCNSYTELNDPQLQRTLLVEQAQRREAGDEEASPLDEEFIEAICQGMPPTAGVGFGVDRLVMIMCNQSSIRDVLFFPLMKPAQS